MSRNAQRRAAFRAAFPHTLPVLAGFSFLGIAYGVYARTAGFSFWYPLGMSIAIFGGSLEFVTVSLLLGKFAPLQTLLLTLMIQSRHLFYGLAMLDKFRGAGLKKLYLIYGMCDESFSINCSAEVPQGVDRGLFMTYVTLLDQLYWVGGATLGASLGSFLPFATKGLDFVMTAMFVVIFLNQWERERRKTTALIGIFSAVACLMLFGSETFLVPTMFCILALLCLLRRPIEKGMAEA